MKELTLEELTMEELIRDIKLFHLHSEKRKKRVNDILSRFADLQKDVEEAKEEAQCYAAALTDANKEINRLEAELAAEKARGKNLECCGNCKIDFDCEHKRAWKLLNYHLCEDWQSDQLTREQREGG
jgi:hypothetical protein